MNFDYFANLVYNHTTAMPQHRALIGANATNLDMGNFRRERLSLGTLRQIFFWARDEAGIRVPLAGTLAKGEQGPSGVTYALTVANNGLQGKGAIAEGLTVSLTLPPGYNVVAATGTGYQGFNQQTATWKLPRSAPKDQEKLTITLSQPLTQTANARGTITWTRPGPRIGGTDPLPVNIAGAPI
jgi:hypothetical protein